jgi:alpha-1,2-mannosyltransferase
MRWRRAIRCPSAEALVIAACAAIALSLRWYQLERPGYLLGVTEYDDGVLFGNALRLVTGVIPYRDFAMVQPPGSMLLMAPAALLAKVGGTAWGLAACRVLTASADTANVVLIGLLVRHRGPLTVGVASGLYAVDPDAIAAAHTLLLEPWLTMFCLAGALMIFDGDRMTADTRRLVLGGASFGFGAAVKIWALVPLGVAVLLLVATGRRRRRLRPAAALAGGAALGLGVPLLPFVALAPGAVARGVVIGQEVRNADGYGSPIGRLADLAGLHLLPVRLDNGLSLLMIGVAIAACYAAAGPRAPRHAARRRQAALDTYALTGALAVTAMLLWPRLYYSHYGAFDGPFLALVIALPAGLLSARLGTRGTPGGRAAVAALAVLALVAAGTLQFQAESRLRGIPAAAAADRLIPSGACVLTNDAAYTVAVDRFYSDIKGCPPMVDSFGTLIAMATGRSRHVSASVVRPVVELWRTDLGRAGYVWLTGNTAGQIPWDRQLYGYFRGHFRLIGLAKPHWSGRFIPRPGLYVRVRLDR